jgi:hypothetical protein
MTWPAIQSARATALEDHQNDLRVADFDFHIVRIIVRNLTRIERRWHAGDVQRHRTLCKGPAP